jgi:hypothetical protein
LCIGALLGGMGLVGGLRYYRRSNLLDIVEHPNPLLRTPSKPIECQTLGIQNQTVHVEYHCTEILHAVSFLIDYDAFYPI